MKKTYNFLFLILWNITFAQNSNLQSGPMVGYCEMKEAVIWLQTKKNASVKIEYFTIDKPSEVFLSDNYTTTKDVGFTFHIVLDKLQPGKKYKYNVFIDNKKSSS